MRIHSFYKTFISFIVLISILSCTDNSTDNTAPVITLNGDMIVQLVQGDSYTEPGATASDDTDGDIPVAISGTVDANTVGTYIITYTAQDLAGNLATAVRTIYVTSPIDTTPPVISLIGEPVLTIIVGELYTEQGATAIDDTDGIVAVTISGTVDSSTPGEYFITYTATDLATNNNSIIRTVNVIKPRPFITTWKTDNFGSSDNKQVKITTQGAGYNFTVDWGDGTTNTQVTGDITHTYSVSGTYTVKINGDFPRLFFDLPSVSYDAEKLLSVEQWGDIKWQSMHKAFNRCSNVLINATDAPNLSNVTDLSYMFAYASNMNQPIGHWNVSTITNMEYLFSSAQLFNQNISNWDVSSVSNMQSMFANAYGFNQDIGNWDVSSVSSMKQMFIGAKTFNQNINNWNVSSVTDISSMFSNATAFNSYLDNWDVSNVKDMSYTFNNAISFNQNLNSWNVSSVSNMNAMYRNASTFNQDISSWDVSSVVFFSNMFSGASSFNQDISTWTTTSAVSMYGMFHNASLFNQNISAWNVSSVQDMNVMLKNTSLSTQHYDALLNAWSTQQLQNKVTLDASPTRYSSSSQSSRLFIKEKYQWIIYDGGPL